MKRAADHSILAAVVLLLVLCLCAAILAVLGRRAASAELPFPPVTLHGETAL